MSMSPGRIIILVLLGLAALVSVTILFYILFIAPTSRESVDEGAVIFTEAAHTLSVQLTEVAQNATGTAGAVTPTVTPSITPQLPTDTPRPTNTRIPIASNTPLPTITPFIITPSPRTRTPGAGGGGQTGTPGTPGVFCNAAKFIADVTIPDGTEMNPGASFIKTWRLENYGYCTWTEDYKLVFVSGDQMSAPSEVPLPDQVSPGEIVDISVPFIAPIIPGDYVSNWKLEDSSGDTFGTGTLAEDPIWVRIEVTDAGRGVALDFVSSACAAEWGSGAGTLPCPGTDGDPDGYVIPLARPPLEDRNEDEPGLLTVPEEIDNGFISGTYPPFTVKNGDEFLAEVGCMADSEKCNVTFRLEYRTANGNVNKLGQWKENFDGETTVVELSLDDLAEKTVEFILSVVADGSANEDNAIWLLPQIQRD